MIDEFKRASDAFNNAPLDDNYGGRRSVPYKDALGNTAYLITDEPLLDEFFAIKRVWLTIQINNPECFDAAAVADAQIQLRKY